MHGVEPSCFAVFGQITVYGILVPSFDVATSRRASKPERSTGGFCDSGATTFAAPVFASNRYHANGCVYDVAPTSPPLFHITGLPTDDTGGSVGDFAALPARVNARSSVGPPT